MRQIQSGGKINKNRLWSDVKFSYGNSFQDAADNEKNSARTG